MNGVTISDRGVSIDLQNILDVLGSAATHSTWRLSGVEATGDSADVFHHLSDTETTVTGAELLNLSRSVRQVIDGTFEATRHNEKTPWIVICAVDSTAYDVVTDEDDVLDAIRRRFQDVQDIPNAKQKFRL